MSIDEVTITVSASNNAVSGDLSAALYDGETAKEYAEQAKIYAQSAKDAQAMAEAWATSDQPPTGEGTRSAKTWSETAREWAESETEPDGVEGAKSSKTWASEAEKQATLSAASAKEAETYETNAKASEAAAEDAAKSSEASAEAAKKSAKDAETEAEKILGRLDGTVGSATNPVYLKEGTLTVCNAMGALASANNWTGSQTFNVATVTGTLTIPGGQIWIE